MSIKSWGVCFIPSYEVIVLRPVGPGFQEMLLRLL